MSLLVDLLSKTKTKESRKDIPPDLRKAVVDGTYKKKTRRKVIILSILVLIVFLAGFGTIYVMENFKSSLSTTIATKTDSRQPIPTPSIRDEVPPSPSKATAHISTTSLAPKAHSFEQISQGKPKTTGESSPKAARSRSRKGERGIPTTIRMQAQSAGKGSTAETFSDEKAQQKTNKDVYLFAARTHETRGEFKQALVNYLKALELNPTNYIIVNNIAGIYIRLKLPSDALIYASKALDIKASYAPSLI